MKLVILIPAYNEDETLGKVIESMPETIDGIDTIDILVMDDGSTDATADLARTAGAVVVSHPYNQGVGKAFNTGLATALEMGADIMVNIDADGQFAPADIPLLIRPIIDGKADFVSGDRFRTPDGKLLRPEYMSRVKFWGNQRMSDLIGFITGNRYDDVSCGFRAYSKEAMMRLNLTGKFTYTQESFLDLANKGLGIRTIPVDVKYFPERKSRVAGSITRYIFQTSKIIFRAYRDYSPLKFFGYLGLVPLLISLALGIFVIVHYATAGAFSPYIFVAFAAVYLFTLGILLWVVGILADMFVRIRLNQEQLLYAEKKRRFDNKEQG
ncbi:MAG: glycosyltransferase family 2 protein [Chloroflexi bacterium]|nr:glycosyltransferase family 2 protein [Chloroflexota bacterium]